MDFVTIVAGTKVSAAADQSTGGHNATQGTGANQPPYLSSDPVMGGRPSISIQSTTLTLANASFSQAQPDTVFAVFNVTNNAVFAAALDGTTARQILARSTINWAMSAGTTIQGGTADNKAHVWCGVFNGASSALYVDNSQTAVVTGNPGAAALTGLSIGSTAGDNSINGEIAEVVIYSGALSAPARQAVFQYLGQRYGIAVQ
jgi:hypothetical protein